jgi:hypothetical protein
MSKIFLAMRGTTAPFKAPKQKGAHPFVTLNNEVLDGHDIAARSCFDLDLQGSPPNVARDTSSQYGDHFCKVVLKYDFK